MDGDLTLCWPRDVAVNGDPDTGKNHQNTGLYDAKESSTSVDIFTGIGRGIGCSDEIADTDWGSDGDRDGANTWSSVADCGSDDTALEQ